MKAELKQFFDDRNWTYVDITNEPDLKTVYNLYIHNDTNFNVEELTPLGLNYVGLYYNTITKNYEEMEKYYLMAIDNGDTIAMSNLGNYHQEVTKNYEKMEKYYLMAIKGGNTLPMSSLSIFYTKNPTKFRNLIQKLFKQETEIQKLKEEIEELKYRPGGPGMLEAQADFENRINRS